MSATVLIVDDEENARINLKKFLAGIGYEFLEAANLTEARQQFSTGNVDMILLDVQLNGDYGP